MDALPLLDVFLLPHLKFIYLFIYTAPETEELIEDSLGTRIRIFRGFFS